MIFSQDMYSLSFIEVNVAQKDRIENFKVITRRLFFVFRLSFCDLLPLFYPLLAFVGVAPTYVRLNS